MGGDRLWTLERQTGQECSQTITITRSGGPVLTSCRREDSQWTERAHRRRTSTGVDYRTQREQVLLRRVDCESQRGVSHSLGTVVPRRRYSLWTGRGPRTREDLDTGRGPG